MPGTSATPAAPATLVEIALCISDEQAEHLPKRRRAPPLWPRDAPMPRVGEVIYLSSSSAWMVRTVIHEWRNERYLRVELWLEWIGTARHARSAGFEVTQ